MLAEKAESVERVEKRYHKLADDMLETMYEAPGIGLAANQVGVLERILVVDTDYELKEPEEDQKLPVTSEVVSDQIVVNRKPIIVINPKIIHREGQIVYPEGCLSVPEYSAEVERAEKIKIEYTTIDGLTKTLSAEGLQAVCLQHEMDHLDGKLFIERLSPLKKEMAKKKLLKERAEREQGQSGEGEK